MRAIVWRMPKFLAVVALVGIIFLGVTWSTRPNAGLRDFGSFYASGQAAAGGLNPYGVYPPLTFYVVVNGFGGYAPNLNPPVSVPLFHGLTLLEPNEAFRLWFALSLASYGLSLLLLARAYPTHVTPLRLFWAFSLAGLWHTLELGQIYMPLLLATVGAWLLLRSDRPWLAGILIGIVVAIKPHFVLWPILMLLAGYWPVALAAFGSAVLVSIVPLLVYGPSIYAQWLPLLATTSNIGLSTNGSLAGFAARLGMSWLGLPLGALIVAALVIWVWRRHPAPLEISALAIAGTLLAAPIAWDGYALLLLPAFVARKPWPLGLRIAAILLLVPVPINLFASETGLLGSLTIGSVYLWAAVATLFGLIRLTLPEAVHTIFERFPFMFNRRSRDIMPERLQ